MSQKEMHFDVEITGTGFFGHDGGGASRGKPNTRAEVEDTAY
jgi:hypothetical protein